MTPLLERGRRQDRPTGGAGPQRRAHLGCPAAVGGARGIEGIERAAGRAHVDDAVGHRGRRRDGPRDADGAGGLDRSRPQGLAHVGAAGAVGGARGAEGVELAVVGGDVGDARGHSGRRVEPSTGGGGEGRRQRGQPGRGHPAVGGAADVARAQAELGPVASGGGQDHHDQSERDDQLPPPPPSIHGRPSSIAVHSCSKDRPYRLPALGGERGPQPAPRARFEVSVEPGVLA